MSKLKFKVGDKVKGTKQSNEVYRITNEDMLLGEITHIYEDRNGINIKVLKHKDKKYEGKEFCCFCFKDSCFELVQPKQFTKADLKERWLVKTRNGREYMLDENLSFREIECGKFAGIKDHMSGLQEDLTNKINYDCDVMEVYKPHYSKVWEREEEPAPKKMTVSEICKELGYDIEIVKEEE